MYTTVGQNNQEYRLEYWATRSSARSFARTAQLFACPRLLASLAPYAALTRSLARSLPRSWESELLMSQNELVLSHSAFPPPTPPGISGDELLVTLFDEALVFGENLADSPVEFFDLLRLGVQRLFHRSVFREDSRQIGLQHGDLHRRRRGARRRRRHLPTERNTICGNCICVCVCVLSHELGGNE